MEKEEPNFNIRGEILTVTLVLEDAKVEQKYGKQKGKCRFAARYFPRNFAETDNKCCYKKTNRPKFSMVFTLIDRRNDVIKCSKLKLNHKPQTSGFAAVLNILWRHFYGL